MCVCVCVCVCVGVYCNSSVVFMGVCYTHAWVVYIISESQLEECSGMGGVWMGLSLKAI